MAKKKDIRPNSPKEDLGFGDLEDDFFKTGESGSFYEDEVSKDDPSQSVSSEAAAREAAEREAAAREAAAREAAARAAREAAAKESAAKEAAAKEAAAKEAAARSAKEAAAKEAAAKESAAKESAAKEAAAKEAAARSARETAAKEAAAKEAAAKEGAAKEAAAKEAAAAAKEAAAKATAAKEAAAKEAAAKDAALRDAIAREAARAAATGQAGRGAKRAPDLDDPTESITRLGDDPSLEAPTEVIGDKRQQDRAWADAEARAKAPTKAPPPPPIPPKTMVDPRLAQQVGGSGSLFQNPTIVAVDDMTDDDVIPPDNGHARPAALDVEDAPTTRMDDVPVSTADEFLEEDPDPSLVKRRQAGSVPAPPTVPEPPSRARPTTPEVVVPAKTLPTYQPTGAAAERWEDVVRTLDREIAAVTDPAARARLQGEAGWILLYRLGDAAKARPLLEAGLHGNPDDRLQRAHADLVARDNDPERLQAALVHRAESVDRGLASELLLDAAAILHAHLKQDDAARALLERALQQAPDDWIALRALRDACHRGHDWQSLDGVLERMAERTEGHTRAEILIERGRLHEEHLKNADGAQSFYQKALEAEPESGAAFLAAERMAFRRRDFGGLAALYAGAADRSGKVDRGGKGARADQVFWLGLAARSAALAGRPVEEVVASYERALAAAGGSQPELTHELDAFLANAGRHAELVKALEAEIEAADPTDKAWLLYRLAGLYERQLQDPKRALELYQKAVAADPSADPAQEAVGRLLVSTGRAKEYAKALEKQLDGMEEATQVAALYRLAEVAEGPLQDQSMAREYYERVLESEPNHLLALEGLERVYTRLEEWEALAQIYRRRAEIAVGPEQKAVQLHRAGAIYEYRHEDLERSAGLYREALEQLPDYPPSLDAYVRIMEKLDNWPGLAAALRNAAHASRTAGTPDQTVSLTYRAARVLADKVGDAQQAIVCLRECLDVNPSFLPALALFRELSEKAGAWEDVFRLHHQAADAASDPRLRTWRLLAAAEAAAQVPSADPTRVLGEILQGDPANRTALQASEVQALRAGDSKKLIDVYQRRLGAAANAAERARVAERLVVVARESGDHPAALKAIDEMLGAEETDRPLVALARLAESLGSWKAAVQALRVHGLAEPGVASGRGVPQRELARIVEGYEDDPALVVEAWREAWTADPKDATAASGLDRALRRAAAKGVAIDKGTMADVNAVLADAAHTPSIRATHALIAGHYYEEAKRPTDAVVYYDRALEVRPGPGRAFDALRRIHVAAKDTAQLKELYAKLPTADVFGLAQALEEADDPAGAVPLHASLAGKVGPNDRLPILVWLEQAQAAADDWKGVFQTSTARLAVTKSQPEREAIEAKRRWVLANKLASTNEAWEFYRKLHEETPGDAEVLEALARIAGARGETALAIQYIDGLSSLAKDKHQSARYQRRIAEAHLNAKDAQAARQAYLKALDYQPDDMEALAGLKDLATQEGNWQALLGVLAREATMLEGPAQVERNREIARIWQTKVGDKAVAADAWRKVLEMVPGDREALRELVALSRAAEDWPALAEFGQALIQHLAGPDRSALLSELGRVYLQKLKRQQEAINFLDAASSGEHPDLEAAKLLESVYQGKDWNMVAEALMRQGRAAATSDQRLKLLLRAAQIKLETLHDRDGAAAIFTKVLEIDSANPDALRFQGDWLYQQKDWEQCVAIFGRMEDGELARDLDDFDAKIEVSLYFYRFADALRTLGRNSEARARFERALSLNPSHLPTLEAVGPLYIELEAWEKARTCFGTILQLTGGQGDPAIIARVYTNLGIVEQRLGDLDKAMKRFNKALDLRPNDIKALQGIASVLFEREDWNNLLNVYNNIIYHAQEPGEVLDAYLTKGFVLDAKLRLPDKAEQHYQKSLALNPAQPPALLRLGELALRRQDWPEAASLADRGLGLKTDTPKGDGVAVRAGLLLVKAVAHKAAGDDKQAAEAFNAALNTDVSLSAELGNEMATWKPVHEALTARLQARV